MTLATALIDRAALAAALANVVRVVERRNTIPILSCVILEPCEGGARIYGTDLDCAVSVVVPAAWEGAPIAVDAFAFLDAVKACDGHAVSLSTNMQYHTALTSGGARFVIAGRNPSDMPRIGAGTRRDAIAFPIPAATLRGTMIDAGKFVSTEEVRYYLNGVFLTSHEGELAAVSTHGHGAFSRKLGMTDAAALVEAFAPGTHSPGVIIPRKACALVARLIGKKADDVAAVALFRDDRAGREFVEMTHGATTVTTKTIDGSFPNWRRVIPAADTVAGIWSVTAGKLAAFARGLTDKRKDAAALDFATSGVRACVGVAHTNAPGEYIGDRVTSGAVAGYLMDLADTFAPDAVLDIAVYPCDDTKRGERLPFAVTSAAAAGQTVLVMPHAAAWSEPAAPSFAVPVPVPGRAEPMFDMTPFCGTDGPRVANDAEVCAYLGNIATRCGLPYLPATRIVGADVPHGVTFGGIITEADDETPAVYQSGAYSVPMPGRRAAPVMVETLNDEGEAVSFAVVAIDRKGALQLAADVIQDLTGLETVKAAGKRGKASVARVEAVPAADVPAAAPIAPSAAETAPIQAAAMFATVAAFKAAAVIGSTWRKVTYDSAGESVSPLLRTVIKVQSRDIAFAVSDAPLSAETVETFAASGAGGSWLGMPKRGEFGGDPRGMLYLDSEGAPRFLYIPVIGAELEALGTDGDARSPVAADYPELHAAAPVVKTADVSHSVALEPSQPVAADPVPVAAAAPDVAALMATVEALAARVIALEARPIAGQVVRQRAPREARARIVAAYLRHRAQRDAIREERAAFRREIAEARASEELAHVQAANARKAATTYKREMETACLAVDRLRSSRSTTARRMRGAREALTLHRATVADTNGRARAAEVALAGAQLASAAAWERVAAFTLAPSDMVRAV